MLSVGDAEFQRRSLGRMQDFGASGRTVLFVSHNMRTVSLCERDPAGRGTDRLRRLRRTWSRTTSIPVTDRARLQEWRDIETAPGDRFVRLRSVRVVERETGDGGRPVSRRHRDRVPRAAVTPSGVPKLKLMNGEGTLFNALDTDPRWHEPAPPGDYVSTAWMPANLLNKAS